MSTRLTSHETSAERPSADDVAQRINRSFRNLFVEDKESRMRPYVCAVCDEFVPPKNQTVLPLKWLVDKTRADLLRPEPWQKLHPDLKSCYKVDLSNQMEANDPLRNNALIQVVDSLLLSPRSTYIRSSRRKGYSGLTCCVSCRTTVQMNNLPQSAIKNNFCVGEPPGCLLELNDYELAFLSPVKSYGYCFSYTGGKQRCLEGSVSYFKVEIKSIVRVATQLEVLGLRKDIVVVLYGKMTEQQRSKAKSKTRLRVDKVLSAVEWLLQNNVEWQKHKSGVDVDELRRELEATEPVVIDDCTIEASDPVANSSNVEDSESYRVFFPDGTIDPYSGGQGSIDKFKDMLRLAKDRGYDLQFQCNFAKESVVDFKDNTLVNSCLLQFPYGRGGLDELRYRRKGVMTHNFDIDLYIDHLSRLSQPQFHRDRFCLILYNMMMRRLMLRQALFRVRNKMSATDLVCDLSSEDLAAAIHGRKNGMLSQNSPGGAFLGAVDAVAKSVPHSNNATKQARRTGECYAHNFGHPSFFLSVTPDDESSFFILVHSLNFDTAELDVENMTDEELSKHATLRHKLRVELPGLCAYFFDRALDIVVKHIIGWDDQNGCATATGGIFGIPLAYIAAIEEQGRRSLHAHILVWIKGFSSLQEGIHSDDKHVELVSKRKLADLVDDVLSTELLAKHNCFQGHCNTAFPHDCSACESSRPKKRPRVVDDQSLRNLRNRRGPINCGGAFAFCGHEKCSKVWTGPSLLSSFLRNNKIVQGISGFPDESQRLKATLIQYQSTKSDDPLSPMVCDAAYNFHLHTQSCFKRTTSAKRERSTEIDACDECRYRYPRRKKSKTMVENAFDQPIKWYSWTGEYESRSIKEVNPKRLEYDAYQNDSCTAISRSKLGCNTNLSVVLPGPVSGYIFKYQVKDTQVDDTEPYERVATNMRKVLEARKHESDQSESLRRVLAASYAHQKNGIVGSAMAAYLTRHKSRFRMSHTTTWCPIRDLHNLLVGQSVQANITHHGKVPFFVNSALHYICRPRDLEDLSVHDFYSKYEVVHASKENRDTLLGFSRTPAFTHPSYSEQQDTYKQGVRAKQKPDLVKVFERDFPDPATFNGNIFSPDTSITEFTEMYSRQILLLFVPFRTIDDLTENGSFTAKLRMLQALQGLPAVAQAFLQNLTNTAYNSWRVKHTQDDLQRNTKLQLPHQFEYELFQLDSEPVQEEKEAEFAEIENLMQHIDNSVEDETNILARDIPSFFDSSAVKNSGTHNAGYECLSQPKVPKRKRTDFVTETERNDDTDGDDAGKNISPISKPPSRRKLLWLLLHKTSRKTKTFKEIRKDAKPVRVRQANGSRVSMIDWADKAKLDACQKRAFLVFAASFVLTYHGSQAKTARLKREKRRLKELSGLRHKNLVALLHGPGGSGKSACIDLLLMYAKEFCENLPGNDYRFTSQTIVVTALTGVAATILKGETVHSRLYLNWSQLSHEQIEAWDDTRMVIIDEISFADKKVVDKIHENLCVLKQNRDPFGAVNIVFSGDFRQLEPVRNGSKPLYEEPSQVLDNHLNCFLELEGMHRFRKDMKFGHILRRIREGNILPGDIEKINSRVVGAKDRLPPGLRYATFYNKDRDAINAGLFDKMCRREFKKTKSTGNAIIIFADRIKYQEQRFKYKDLKNYQHFWSTTGESNIHSVPHEPRIDPVLKLYEGCPVMLPSNIDVQLGQANGTRAILERVVLQEGQLSKTINYAGMPVAAVTASQVDYIVVRHENESLEPFRFHVSPKHATFNADVLLPRSLQDKPDERKSVRMQATQIPLLVNNATTGHKLQGATIDRIFVHSWRYEKNWPYVVLSRVTSLKGLFLRQPISSDSAKYAMPYGLKQMLQRYRQYRPQQLC